MVVKQSMFCFQCEQTMQGIACEHGGVCGKTVETANLQDDLIGALIGLAKVVPAGSTSDPLARLVLDGLFTTLTNVNFDDPAIQAILDKVEAAATDVEIYDMNKIWHAENEDIRSLKTLTLLGLKGMAAYAHQAAVLGYIDATVDNFFLNALRTLGNDNASQEELLALTMKTGKVNFTAMKVLDQANTEVYGNPQPTEVPLTIEPGPFIVISGHDLYDLKQLLEQTAGKGINVYTHGEMLPAHGYPELKAYPQLKGNFGTAWQNQQKEFKRIPAPILFTTNCIMPVGKTYHDRVYTTSVVGYPDMVHIGADKDFSPLIDQALELGGYTEPQEMTGINGGHTVTTGFGHKFVLDHADTVVKAVKDGDLKHIILVGGCDGARVGRNYYTQFVEDSPENTLILTCACGKYRFNDMNLGTVAGLPRMMDMGQCNDAYSAIKVALALADAFDCEVNDLPLDIVLSWYEQKAVSVLLTLLALGIKNIYLGPTLPAFVSPHILDYLKENFALTPISTAKADLARILTPQM
ncbi:hydroxylamine reductase [Loigolactobacillus binensis]|uniref:Hydroxylamine reductase n=1 Tax=Loigolactobacillus binensis TaxID=2559922 RepID=A0ABW3E9X5_9LACO|nr:hydroxylamine reductase [Loigolactobacillus binensis]